MLQRGNDLADLNEYDQLFSKEEQAANWSQFTGFSKELTAKLRTQDIFQNFNTDLNLNPT